MITQFHVANYKALRDVTLDLTPIHVLIGPNGSGKSSILEAAALLSWTVTDPVQSFWPAGTDFGVLPLKSGQPIAVNCEIKGENLSGEYGFRFEISPLGSNSGPIPLTDEYFKPLNGGHWKSEIGSNPMTAVRLATQSSNWRIVPKEIAVGVTEQLAGIIIQRWNPGFLRMPVVLSGDHRLEIDRSGFGLAQCLDDILGMDRTKFAQLEGELSRMFPEILNIQLISETAYQWPKRGVGVGLPQITGQSGKGIRFKLADEKTIPAAQASDGLLIILGYLTQLHLPNPPRVFMIEEPENGIHPERVREIIGLLRKLIKNHPNTQILMTTHSPYLLDEFQPEEVTLCSKATDGSVSVRRLSDIPDVKRQLDVFRLGEIWTAEGDDQLAKSPVEGAK